MTHLDGFSGYGGFSLAFKNAGWKFDHTYFSEIDKHAIANFKHNFPDAKYAGSITTISRDTVPDIDLFTFGWPCQDNSIAGKRKGQSAGTRSGLLHEAVRIINEFKPRHFVAENVTGLFSVNAGKDFFEALKLLTYLNQNCPQYDIEMQLLNTRWVLPQNRERLFFVGHLRGSGSRKIFPIGDCIESVSASGNGKDIAGCISTKNQSGQCQFDGGTTLIYNRAHGYFEGSVSNTHTPTINSQSTNYNVYVATIAANTKQGYETVSEGDSINFPLPSSKTRRGRVGKGVAQTLDTSCNQGVITHYGHKDKEAQFHDISPTLKAQSHGHEPMVIVQKNYSKGNSQGKRIYETNVGVTIPSAPGGNKPLYEIGKTIRRLTPTECERLQGLPDGWTQYGNYDGGVKEISDTQRYRLCGNGVSIPIVELIANALKQ